MDLKINWLYGLGEKMICKKCGNTLREDANFCNKCGQSVENDALQKCQPKRLKCFKNINFKVISIFVGIIVLLTIGCIANDRPTKTLIIEEVEKYENIDKTKYPIEISEIYYHTNSVDSKEKTAYMDFVAIGENKFVEFRCNYSVSFSKETGKWKVTYLNRNSRTSEGETPELNAKYAVTDKDIEKSIVDNFKKKEPKQGWSVNTVKINAADILNEGNSKVNPEIQCILFLDNKVEKEVTVEFCLTQHGWKINSVRIDDNERF